MVAARRIRSFLDSWGWEIGYVTGPAASIGAVDEAASTGHGTGVDGRGLGLRRVRRCGRLRTRTSSPTGAYINAGPPPSEAVEVNYA